MIDLDNTNNQKLITLAEKVENYRHLCCRAKEYIACLENKNRILAEMEEAEQELANIYDDSKERDIIQKRIDTFYDDDNYIGYELDMAEDLLAEYERLLKPIEKEYLHERAEELKKYIPTIDRYNSNSSALFNDTKTLPIIDRFYNSRYDFLLLKVNSYVNPLTYIIVRAIEDVEHYEMSPYITDLKNGESDLLADLMKCTKMVDNEFRKNRRKRVFAFDKPCPLRAQTYDDRTDFNGKQYGETKNFFIIGISYL